jgi:hypothetical protein
VTAFLGDDEDDLFAELEALFQRGEWVDDPDGGRSLRLPVDGDEP